MLIQYAIGIIVVGVIIVPLTFLYKEHLVKKHRQRTINKALDEYQYKNEDKSK